MSGRRKSVRVMLRLNLDDPRMARAMDILEEGMRQERYKSKSHMIVDALLRTFDEEMARDPPTIDAIRAALREEMRSARLIVSPAPPEPEAPAGNDAEDDAAVLDFIGNL